MSRSDPGRLQCMAGLPVAHYSYRVEYRYIVAVK